MIKKLNSNRGASLIIALVYFVVSMSIGAAILSMALANISRVKAEKKMENTYLAVRSAAELYQSKIAAINGEWEYKAYSMNPDTNQLNNDAEDELNELNGKLRDSICVKSDNNSNMLLSTELSKLIYDVFLDNNKMKDVYMNYDASSIGSSDVQAKIAIVPDGKVSDEQMQVKIYAEFSPTDKNLTDEDKCYITVEGTGIVDYQLIENVSVEEKTTGPDSEGNYTTEEIEHYSYDAKLKISIKDFYTYKGKYTAATGG